MAETLIMSREYFDWTEKHRRRGSTNGGIGRALAETGVSIGLLPVGYLLLGSAAIRRLIKGTQAPDLKEVFSEPPSVAEPPTVPAQAKPVAEDSKKAWAGVVGHFEEHVKAGEAAVGRPTLDNDTRDAVLVLGEMDISPEQYKAGDEARDDLNGKLLQKDLPLV